MHKMSDSGTPRQYLASLWDEILRRQWNFLESEESIQKLEERKKLEGCLQEFLCIVPYDRRFFLPETAHVLKKSIQKSSEFSAYKAMIGFESISQYANNLFTKPWRKEFRVLKMYSGYYQHEIKSNLYDAEKLFEAMGYRRLSDDVLILDGPICPDQVTNVSRDAMAAYIECKIMKQINAGLLSIGLSCTWKEIFHYRENNIGTATQAIKGLALIIQEREANKENLVNLDNCPTMMPHPHMGGMPTQPLEPTCQKCAMNKANHMHAQPHQLVNKHCMMHGGGGNNFGYHQPHDLNMLYNNMNNEHMSAKPQYGMPGVPHQAMMSHMAHSRSLEHYNEVPAALPHRHSFDNQQDGCIATHHPHKYPQTYNIPSQNIYESPYDCIDGVSGGGSSASYAAVAAASAMPNSSNMNCNYNTYMHPYNISGNRYPLPHTISNQLNAIYAMPNVACNTTAKRDPYNGIENEYATISKSYNYNNCLQAPAAHMPVSASHLRQRTFPSEQLIDFSDREPMTLHDYHAKNHYGYDENAMYDARYDRHGDLKDIGFPQQQSETSSQLQSSEGSCIYARPLSRSNRSRASLDSSQVYDKFADYAQDESKGKQKERSVAAANAHSDNMRRKYMNEREKRISNDAVFDEFVTVGISEKPQRLTSQMSRNQDGVGSFESWNYVFQNLERSGYSKDQGERGDLLVQSLGLDAHNSTTEKRRKNHPAEAKASTQSNSKGIYAEPMKVKAADKAMPSATGDKLEKRETKPSLKPEASILKQTSSNTMPGSKNRSTTKSSNVTKTKSPATIDNNNENGNMTLNVDKRRSEHNKASSQNTHTSTKQNTINRSMNNQQGANTKQHSVAASTITATQMIVTSPNEWSCKFCTFLNPDTKRICEMCSRSKDCNLDISNTPTCV